jgi:4-amino-4-deoxy-L-arabinose transferase-like glycosyltransferase
MDIVLGLTGLVMVIIATHLLGVKFPGLKIIIWGASLIRIISVLFHEYILKLPDGTKDAIRFEANVWNYSQLTFIDFLYSFNSVSKAYTFTWFLSFFYRIFGRSTLLLETVHIFISLASIVIVYKLSWLLSSNELKSKQSAAIFAFFPSIILYSVIILREVYIVFFILLIALFIVNWLKSGQIKYALFSLLLFLPLYFLHGGLMIGAVMFFIILIYLSIKNIYSTFKNKHILVPQMVFILFVLITMVIAFNKLSTFDIPYLGNISQVLTLSRIFFQAEVTNLGGSAYPGWLIPFSPSSFVLLIIPRLIYFLFSPFLWDIKAINHLLGFVDALLVIILFYFIIKGMVVKKPNKPVIILCIFLLPLLITYSWGVGNFGTALRHRSKFIPVLIAISTIYVPKITLRRNLKVYKSVE